MEVRSGRFGPYVKFGKVNATIPKGTAPESLTMEEAVRLIAAKTESAGSAKSKGKGTAKAAKTRAADANGKKASAEAANGAASGRPKKGSATAAKAAGRKSQAKGAERA